MKLQYLRAETSDIPRIYHQAKNLIDTYENLASIDYENVLTWVQRKITQMIGQYIRVTAEGEICAYYRLCDDGEVDDLYVLPDFQNRGIGSEILKKCIHDSAYPLYLCVYTRNIRAISFYERFGFSVSKVVGNTRLILRRNG